jgi:hypothetical protein
VVAQGDRLGRLQVGITRHDRRRVGLGLVDQRALQLAQTLVETVDGFAHPEPEVGRHLVVARARGMQASRRLADQLRQAALHVHVDILERGLEGEAAVLDFSQDRV